MKRFLSLGVALALMAGAADAHDWTGGTVWIHSTLHDSVIRGSQSESARAWPSPSLLPSGKLNYQPATSKSVGKALWLAIGSTAVPTGLGFALAETKDHRDIGHVMIVLGMGIGPSVGNMYAADWGRTFSGMGIRVSAYVVLVMMAVANVHAGFDDDPSTNGFSERTIWTVSGTIYGVGMLYSILTAPASVREYNLKHSQLQLNPILYPKTKAVGLSMRYKF